MSSKKITLCKTSDVPEKKPKCLNIDVYYFAVYRSGEDFIIIKDECPHQMASFEGCESKDGTIVCGFHGWSFDLNSGDAIKGFGSLTKYKYTIEDGFIIIDYTDDPMQSDYSASFVR